LRVGGVSGLSTHALASRAKGKRLAVMPADLVDT
jgi:hypothetical protein